MLDIFFNTLGACHSAQDQATLTNKAREKEKVQILTQTVNWRWRWREREKAGKNTENKGGNCQGEQEDLRVSFLVLPLQLQPAMLLTFALPIKPWRLKKIARHTGDGAALSAGHRSHCQPGWVPRFTPLFAVWRARSGVRVSWKPLVKAIVYGATCINWLLQHSQWEREAAAAEAVGGEATGPNVASSRHSGPRSTMWLEQIATTLFQWNEILNVLNCFDYHGKVLCRAHLITSFKCWWMLGYENKYLVWMLFFFLPS